jgi:GT2 family glycosyltransferase
METIAGAVRKPGDNGSGRSDRNLMVSVVIVNYKSRDYLRACLQSIFVSREIEYEVIVADNGSDDGSVDMVREQFPEVTLIDLQKNAGFARANNIAIAKAVGKYILVLNPDTELKSDTLKRLTEFMENAPSVSAAGCKVLYPDGRNQLSCGYLPTVASAIWGGQAINRVFRKIFPGRNFIGACGIDPDDLDSHHEVETLLGACFIVRKDVLEKVGLFDEKMFVYFEECDLFYRIRSFGGRIMFTPDTAVYHHAGGSSSKTLKDSVKYYLASQEYYFRKNLSLVRVLPFRVAVMISALVKAVLLSAACLLRRKGDNQQIRYKISWHQHIFLHLLKNLFSR